MTAQQPAKRRNWLKIFTFGVFFCFGIVAIWVCFLNIQPYIRAVKILLGIAGSLEIKIPIIGDLISWVIGFIINPYLIGVALWGIIQFFELLPELLKEFFSSASMETIKKAARLRGIFYAIDLLICLICFPPIKGGIGGFLLFFSAPSLNDIDWWNLAYIVITLYAVEALWAGYQWLQDILKKAK